MLSDRIALGEAGIVVVRKTIRRIQGFGIWRRPRIVDREWPRSLASAGSRSAKRAGCRMCSKARQSPASRHSRSLRQSERPWRNPLPQPKHRTGRPCRARAGCLEAIRLESGRAKMRSSEIRIVLDVGHTAESEGAISARNVAEFIFICVWRSGSRKIESRRALPRRGCW